jgi:NAD(P)-dependent dehydrogenase (short-subunit alcohol dehydrogenase family)
MGSLTNKKIIVTGGTMGIGQAVVLRAAKEGADVAFCGLTEHGATETTRAVEAAGQRAFFTAVDLRDLGAARQFAREAIEFLGGLDGLVNNAGANTWHSVAGASFEDIENCFRTNFYHAWALAQEAYPVMKAAGGGVIVNMSSIQAERTMPGVFPYNVAKAMLAALTRSIAMEWGHDNIRSVAIQPALTMTPLAVEYFAKFDNPDAEKARMLRSYPLNRGAEPGEIAATIVHVLSGENGFISGAPILIDGGISTLIETPHYW